MNRAQGYIWGNKRVITEASENAPLDLVNIPRFDVPRTVRVDLQGPFSGSAVNVEFAAQVGRGDGFAEKIILPWDRRLASATHVLHCSSLRVSVRYLSGAPIPAGVTGAAWATLCTDAGRSASKPQTFGNAPVAANVAQSVAAQAFVVGATVARRRLTVANSPAAGTERLLLAYGRVVTALDFDYIVSPYQTLVEEAWQGDVYGIWTAAGAGFARVSTWAAE